MKKKKKDESIVNALIVLYESLIAFTIDSNFIDNLPKSVIEYSIEEHGKSFKKLLDEDCEDDRKYYEILENLKNYEDQASEELQNEIKED